MSWRSWPSPFIERYASDTLVCSRQIHSNFRNSGHSGLNSDLLSKVFSHLSGTYFLQHTRSWFHRRRNHIKSTEYGIIWKRFIFMSLLSLDSVSCLWWYFFIELFQRISETHLTLDVPHWTNNKILAPKKSVLYLMFCHNSWYVFGEGLCILYNLSRTISKCVTSSISLTASLMASLYSQSFAKCKLTLKPSHTCSLPIVSDVSSV